MTMVFWKLDITNYVYSYMIAVVLSAVLLIIVTYMCTTTTQQAETDSINSLLRAEWGSHIDNSDCSASNEALCL